ncbi:MAG TPA: cysteine desulfurase-like protein [Actinomycetota bacterium]|nr:cysteine desulfurase-like protein [Actinomycetota bacterium]
MRTEEHVDLSFVRERFPALAREQGGREVVFADAPGGTQMPRSVIDAIADYLANWNANLGGAFETSRRSDAVLAEAHAAAAAFVGATPQEMVIGQNTTTIAFHLSRSFAKTLQPGDEVVVTVLDHDANVTPWVRAAGDAGATVRRVDVHTDDCTLDLDSLDAALTDRTRLVAFTLASNAVGTVTPAAEIVRRVHEAGALAVADGVHFAPHESIDVAELGVDVLFTSPYKYFGPHLGAAFARRELLETWDAYKVRPAPDTLPDRWETGTLSHEALAGLTAAVDYVASLGDGDSLRGRVVAGMRAITVHEGGLTRLFLEGIAGIDGLTLYGIADADRWNERTPTFAIRIDAMTPRELAEELARRGIFVWDGNYYALSIMERLGLEESGGAARIGFCHYNTPNEVDRVVADLADVAAKR